MKYSFRHLDGSSLEALARSVEVELKNLELTLESNELVHLDLKLWYEAPLKLYEGLFVVADGTTWDPGVGGGGSYLAYYNGTTWRKVG